MDLVQVFADLDAQPWAELEHAYGSAEDLPEQLRALAGADEEEAGEALGELYSCILHQGSVYEASARAVPYLAGLAAAGVRADDLLVLLGGIAESEAVYDGTPPGECQAAVIGQLPLILPLVDAEDAVVRQAAVWAAARTGAVEPVLPVLLRRWEREEEPLVRAELLAGAVLLDQAGAAAADIVTAALEAGEPGELRIAAVLGSLDLGLPWTGTHHQAVLSLLPADPLVADRFDLERTEPLHRIVEALLDRDTSADREAAFALLDFALRVPDDEVRAEALWATEQACVSSRSAPARLTNPLIALLDDRASARPALSALDKLGPYAATAAPALAALATDGGDPGPVRPIFAGPRRLVPHLAALSESPKYVQYECDPPPCDARHQTPRADPRRSTGQDLADRALKALVVVDPERAAPLLARDLPERPAALGAACGFPYDRLDGPFPYHPELLAAARARLTVPELDGNEPIHLTRLLASWGELAAPAFPELAALLGRFPAFVPAALAAVDPGRAVVPLEEAAVSGPEQGRFAAARALHSLTGDLEPLLTVLAAELAADDTHRIRQAARATADLGKDAAVLVPRLREALGTDDDRVTAPRLDADLDIALALWRLTGDPGEALPVIAAVLDATDTEWMRWTAVNAARAAARLGPAAAALRPALERGLADPERAPAMALALLATGAATQHHADRAHHADHARLADTLLRCAERDADPVCALEALAALGPESLTEPELHRLTSLAERDHRVWSTGLESDVVSSDARFQEAARALLRTATASRRTDAPATD
ncbi:hypothetical protein [Streptomyces scopuliridis]|uniref:hypothetical protein n=1 Tax=Streptomyces scopuliridis TaxID=452529 RepID=UPI003687AC45